MQLYFCKIHVNFPMNLIYSQNLKLEHIVNIPPHPVELKGFKQYFLLLTLL